MFVILCVGSKKVPSCGIDMYLYTNKMLKGAGMKLLETLCDICKSLVPSGGKKGLIMI